MNRLLDQPRLLGLVCAALAVGLGIVYLAAAGAPARAAGSFELRH